MTKADLDRKHRTAAALGLAMLLGPLAALSYGSRYADESTLARAEAGRKAVEAREMIAANVEGDRVTSSDAGSDSMRVSTGS